MKTNKLLKKFIYLTAFSIMIISTLFIISSCESKDALQASKTLNLSIPGDAALIIKDVKARGVTLVWNAPDNKYYEYAVAATSTISKLSINTYEEALENDCIVLNFTANNILNGEYKVKNLIAGRDYNFQIFIRGKNTRAENYLSGQATLPYLDEAEILSLEIIGQDTLYDKANDKYSAYYLSEKPENLKFKYTLARNCSLYINGELTEEKEIAFKADETIYLTVINDKTMAGRDYEVSVKQIDTGLPLIIINTDDGKAVTRKDRDSEAEMTIIDSSYNPLGAGLYDGPVTIRLRGNSSSEMPKKSFNITLTLPENAKKPQILDMGPHDDWALIASYTDKSLMRNHIAYEMYRDLGAFFSPKSRFADVVVNGDYVGTYMLVERIKIHKNRLNIDKITLETPEENLTGGYILEVNSTDKYSADEVIFETNKINWNRGHFFSIKSPNAEKLPDAAYEYIKNYVNEAENALFSENFKDPEKGFRAYIDTDSVIDWLIVNEVFKQVDANFHTSTYFYKPRGDKLYMGPVWDFDLGGGNADYSGCDDPKGWYVLYAPWLWRIFEDEQFAQDFKNRWNEIKDTVLPNTFERIDKTAELIYESQTLNFAKWPILGVYVWPNAGEVSERTTYESEVKYLKDWLTQRIEWMDGNINGDFLK